MDKKITSEQIEKNNIKILNEILEKYKKSKIGTKEIEIAEDIKKCLEQNFDPILASEHIAFGFSENNAQNNIYDIFRCRWTYTEIDTENTKTFPDLSVVSQEMVQYWANRTTEVEDPFYKARYAGLVFQFADPTTMEKRKRYEMALLRIDCIIELATNSNTNDAEYEIFSLLENAINIAIGIKDEKYIILVRDTLLEFENKIANKNKIGLWGYSFELLLNNKKVKKDEKFSLKIVSTMEERLNRVSSVESLDPWAAEKAAILLGDYYQVNKMYTDVRRVLLKYRDAFKLLAEKSSTMLASDWFEKISDTFRKFQLNDDADELLKYVQNFWQKNSHEIKSNSLKITETIEIDKEIINNIVCELNEGDLNEAIIKISQWYIPKKAQIQEYLLELSKKTPLVYSISKRLHDESGRYISSVGPIENDLDGHVVLDIAQRMTAWIGFLNSAIEKLIEKFNLTPELFLETLFLSPVFEESIRPLFNRGIIAFFKNDPVECIHILVPLFERAIRKLVELAGGITFSLNKNGSHQLKTLNDLLRDDDLNRILGEDITLYLRVLFTDPRGLNLRNNLCHGLMSFKQFNKGAMLLVIHALMILNNIRTDSSL